MHTRTKIICTMGPAVWDYDNILKLIDAGMNVARLNFSHGSHEQHKKTIDLLKKAREDRKVPLAILLDTKGPEIRVGKIKDDAVELYKDQELKIYGKPIEGTNQEISITPEHVIDDIKEGMKVLFDDGYIGSHVIAKHKDHFVVKIENSGLLSTHKGVNIPHGEINLPSLTEKDRSDLEFGCENDVDIIAASFVRTADNVLEIREFLRDHWHKEIMIISKIESVMGVENFDSILQVSDGIMVARGDLGVELPLNKVPKLQKMMIHKCYQMGKPVVTATQMLESMIHHPRPTRAEVSDVANAIYDSTSCVMLSGETAIGKYPVETVQIMKSIIHEAEGDFDYEHHFKVSNYEHDNDISSSVALAAVKIAYNSDVKAIFAYTSSGFTSRLISRLRPKIPIVSLTSCKKTYHQIAFLWGVIPVFGEYNSSEDAFVCASCYTLESQIAGYGDLVIATAGTPFGIRGTTNMMVIESIGDVLVRGVETLGDNVTGQCVLLLTHDENKSYPIKGKIVVLTHCDKSYEKILKGAIGIILQNHKDDAASEESALEVSKKLGIPLIPRAENAAVLLKEDEEITLVPKKGLVFRGRISSEEELIEKMCKVKGK